MFGDSISDGDPDACIQYRDTKPEGSFVNGNACMKWE